MQRIGKLLALMLVVSLGWLICSMPSCIPQPLISTWNCCNGCDATRHCEICMVGFAHGKSDPKSQALADAKPKGMDVHNDSPLPDPL